MKNISNIVIKKINTSLTVKNIDSVLYNAEKFILLSIYIKEFLDEKLRETLIQQEIHIVDKLRVKLLININILISENINLNFHSKQIMIYSCSSIFTKMHITVRNRICVK